MWAFFQKDYYSIINLKFSIIPENIQWNKAGLNDMCKGVGTPHIKDKERKRRRTKEKIHSKIRGNLCRGSCKHYK